MAKFRIGEQNICYQGQEPWEWTGEGEVGVSIKGKTMDPCCVRSFYIVIMTIVVDMQKYTDDKIVESLINTQYTHTKMMTSYTEKISELGGLY